MQETWTFLARGGPIMAVLGLLSLLALAFFFERWLFLQQRNVMPRRFLDVLRKHLTEGRWREARQLCDGQDSLAAQLASAGLHAWEQGAAAVTEALEERGRRLLSDMERFTGALGTIATVSPLLGLLGTITGMITTFQAVDMTLQATGQVSPGALASGIWEALVTTAAGLAIAIPAYLGYRMLLAKVDRCTLALEELAGEISRAARAGGRSLRTADTEAEADPAETA